MNRREFALASITGAALVAAPGIVVAGEKERFYAGFDFGNHPHYNTFSASVIGFDGLQASIISINHIEYDLSVGNFANFSKDFASEKLKTTEDYLARYNPKLSLVNYECEHNNQLQRKHKNIYVGVPLAIGKIKYWNYFPKEIVFTRSEFISKMKEELDNEPNSRVYSLRSALYAYVAYWYDTKVDK